MPIIVIILLFLISFPLRAQEWVPGNDDLKVEEILSMNEAAPSGVRALPLSKDAANAILNDYKSRVSSSFAIPEEFKTATVFWFYIYTQYSSSHLVLHDRSHLELIYDVIDFSKLQSSTLNPYVKKRIQSKRINERMVQIRQALIHLSTTRNPTDPSAKTILKSIEDSHLDIPTTPEARRKFFKELSLGIRSQTGQRDLIHQGIVNSLPYRPFILYYLDQFQLPSELLAISFLESSFNINARSSANASGVWQIMPNMARRLLPYVKKRIDGRNSVVLSTLAAFHLLKQNWRILHRWDLAVASYNSGTKHILRAKTMWKMSDLNLGYFVKHYKHPHIGFASVNFYAEFLALVHTLAYKELIYPLDAVQGRLAICPTKAPDLSVYISKCSFVPNTLFYRLYPESPLVWQYNAHIHSPKNSVEAGTLVISDVALPTLAFQKMGEHDLVHMFPKNFKKKLIRQSCSIK